MAVTLASITAVADRDGNKIVTDQVNLASQVIGDGVFKKDMSCEGSVKVINVLANGLGSVGTLTGGATYFTAESNSPTQLLARPVSLMGHVSLPIDAAKLVSGKKDSIDLIKRHFQMLGDNLGHEIGVLSIDGYLGAVEANATISGTSTATLSVNRAAGFRVGQRVDIYNAAASSKTHNARITAVVPDGDGTVTLSLAEVKDSSAVLETSGTISASDGVWRQGALTPAAGSRFTSLADACGSADLYATTVSDSDWSGNSTNVAGSLSLEAMREMWFKILARSNKQPTDVIMSPEAFQDYEQLHVSNRRYIEGDKMDAFGKNALKPVFSGTPICVDVNCPDSKVFFHNRDVFKIGVWDDFGGLGGQGDSGIDVSQTAYSYLIKQSGMFNGLVYQRNALGVLTGVTLG